MTKLVKYPESTYKMLHFSWIFQGLKFKFEEERLIKKMDFSKYILFLFVALLMQITGSQQQITNGTVVTSNSSNTTSSTSTTTTTNNAGSSVGNTPIKFPE